MKRDILFKGKRVDNGEWVFGSLFNALSGLTIIENGGDSMSDFNFINPETVCQFTGLLDKNDDKILLFEGDLLSLDGKILGNKHETEIHKRETHIIIPSITSKDWLSAYTFAVDRGFRHA